MKRIFLWLAAAAFAACSSPKLNVSVTNLTVVDRQNETIEIPWAVISARVTGATPENIVVLDSRSNQIPSQVLFLGGDEPQSLIFQTDAAPNEVRLFTVAKGQRDNFRSYVFGRQVPERYDDYAWENDRAAYRLYGPALETSPEKLITPGIDVWVKRSDELVIDRRYQLADYHHDNGDGLDCYKVGVTLGGGGCVPFIDGRLQMSEYVDADGNRRRKAEILASSVHFGDSKPQARNQDRQASAMEAAG